MIFYTIVATAVLCAVVGYMIVFPPEWAKERFIFPHVKGAMMRWMDAVREGDVDKIAALYMTNAVLVPTLGSQCCTPEERRAYFNEFTNRENMEGTVQNLHFQVKGIIAIASGEYTFRFDADGEPHVIPARFSFTFLFVPWKFWRGYRIMHHHSSVNPGVFGRLRISWKHDGDELPDNVCVLRQEQEAAA